MLHVGGSEASALWLWVAFGFVFYFLPFAIATLRENGREALVLLIDAFLGWTLVGWFAAMYLALHDDLNAPREPVKRQRQKRATQRLVQDRDRAPGIFRDHQNHEKQTQKRTCALLQ